ncbi:MAG: transcription antitermination factor NusB [Candidatus Marinimicrobia bacterium]|nr:transcription antitermination factor NusB [Candidatus Neomarinimicrobiota bacterium]
MTTTKKHPRRIGREAVLQALFALELSKDDSGKVLEDILERYNFDKKTSRFVSDLFKNTLEYQGWAEEKIQKFLENWRFERVARLDRLILIMAISEIYTVESVPPKVSIAEAIEIAKEFSTDESPGFVNGILDAVYRELNENKEKENS